MQLLNPAPAQLVLPDLDSVLELDALRLVADVRVWTHLAFEEQMVRARVAGHSWRTIAAASGVNTSTTRRWALDGLPRQPRRRL